ncbi:putative ankyrin repeat and ELMO domain-containing protein D-like isoform 2 [Capsicum annuum]|nr:putative ankyrin repeat and ELMO domain-containing protein D-like isoform 2 [Capsicum annuum]
MAATNLDATFDRITDNIEDMKGHVERLRQLVSTLIPTNPKPKVQTPCGESFPKEVAAQTCEGLSHRGKDEHTHERQGKIANSYTLVHVNDEHVTNKPLTVSSSLPTYEYIDSLPLVDDVPVVRVDTLVDPIDDRIDSSRVLDFPSLHKEFGIFLDFFGFKLHNSKWGFEFLKIYIVMTSTLRRRLHHGDVGGRKNEHFDSLGSDDGLNEPLLGYQQYDDTDQGRLFTIDPCGPALSAAMVAGSSHGKGCTLEDILDEGRRRERLHWTLLFSHLISQWAQWLGVISFVSNFDVMLFVNVVQSNIVVVSGSLLGRIFPFASTQAGATENLLPPLLSPLQEARLKHLKQRLAIPFDGSSSDHQDALRQLWRLSYPDRPLPSLKSELWKEMGWQGSDPSTDFRGGGFISLENLIFFAKTYPSSLPLRTEPVRKGKHRRVLRSWVNNLLMARESFRNLLHKRNGNRSEWEYPFAVAGINISFMLVQMLDLQSGTPRTLAGIHFLELLSEDDMAFDNIFCVAFEMLDAQWLAKRASYMEFNEVLKATRVQLERELALEDTSSVKDLPAYNLLRR